MIAKVAEKRWKMIKNDKKVAFRKHLERLTLSDVRGRSGGWVQLVATGSQGFRWEPRKRLVVLCPLPPSRLGDRSRKPFACPPSSEPAVRRPVICPATTRVHVRDLSRHLAFLGATCRSTGGSRTAPGTGNVARPPVSMSWR